MAGLRPGLLSLVLLTWACPAQGQGAGPADCPELVAVTILSAVAGGQAGTVSPRYARADEPVTLHARVSARFQGKRESFDSAASWPAGCLLSLSWFKLEARVQSYDNSHSAPPAVVDYAATPWKEGWSAVVDVHPTLMHDQFPEVPTGLGTMRFQVVAASSAGTVSSPGLDCREGGALCRSVPTVALRPDDSYLGYLHELFNTPYIYGSKRIKGGHQSDLLVGSDCADFAVYGKRRQRGRSAFDYTYTGGLYKLARKRWPVTLDEQGFYLDSGGRRLAFGPGETVRPGDLINWPGGHVGVLVSDDGNGLLDTADLVMHTLFREPEIVPIRDCRWGRIEGKEILRLKD